MIEKLAWRLVGRSTMLIVRQVSEPSFRKFGMSGKRDYSLTGAAAKAAVEKGLASAQWYHTEVPRAQMKALMQRSDAPALRDTAVWFAVLAGSAAGGIWFWGTLWCVPFWLVYGVMYASASDSRWHECGH